MKYFLFFFLYLVAFPAQSQNWKQVNSKTEANFKIKNFGVNVDGSFKNIEITTNFSKSNFEDSFINAEIQISSVKTGIEKRDKHLLEKDYFYQLKYPKIKLKSSKIKKVEDSKYQIIGVLEIKGIQKNIEIPITVNETNDKLEITSEFTINRRDFKVGGGTFIMSKNVKVFIKYLGVK